MLFHTPSFLFLFLPCALVACWLAPRGRPSSFVLMLTSLAFYAFAGVWPLALLVAMTAVAYVASRLLASSSAGRRRLGLATLALLLAVLIAFKVAYGGGHLGDAIPLGISFYTFNLVSYGLDVLAKRAPSSSFLDLATYSTFFPTVASGPLLRFGDFDRERRGRDRLTAGLVEIGLLSLIVGLAKKLLIADPMGAAIEPLFADYERLGSRDAWLAVLGYAYQLYFDFSGYTDIATGVAALLGIRVPRNFQAPYSAIHITDFWQRWHMTMSRWFRDYLFLPLSRALLRRTTDLEGSDRVRSLCLVLTMVVIGFWHGATWAFLAWGLYHGLLLAGHAALRPRLRLRVPTWASRALTFLAVLFGWVLLRSPSPAMAGTLWGALVGLRGWGRWTQDYGILAASLGALLVVTNTSLEAYLTEPRRTRAQSWALAALLALSLLSMGDRNTFLYFQF